MTTSATELRSIAQELRSKAQVLEQPKIRSGLASLRSAVERIGRSWSGSWIGYHAHVYYRDFGSPPPGAHFSSEWGLYRERYGLGTTGDWIEHNPDSVRQRILDDAGRPDLDSARKVASQLRACFEDAQAAVVSILEIETKAAVDQFLARLLGDVRKLETIRAKDVVKRYGPQGEYSSRDAIAVHQGIWTPPHVDLLAQGIEIEVAGSACESLSKICVRAADHIDRKARKRESGVRNVTKVFIGHGRSHAWRELRDFLRDRLRLDWDEFNRVPIAGVSTVDRLSQMLDEARFAFLVLTAEDETKEGDLQARMNVIHEAGLFQGRLGFTRAILLLEDGCAEFSNIHGLGQIRFSPGAISTAFEEIRRVLEREGVIAS